MLLDLIAAAAVLLAAVGLLLVGVTIGVVLGSARAAAATTTSEADQHMGASAAPGVQDGTVTRVNGASGRALDPFARWVWTPLGRSPQAANDPQYGRKPCEACLKIRNFVRRTQRHFFG